jgi:hypothetical protein
MALQLRKKSLTIIVIVILALSLGVTFYISWTVERDDSLSATEAEAAADYYKDNLPIFEDICGDGFLVTEYGEECEFGNIGGVKCEWEDGCNQNTCKCED